jgi:hypothetical protein
MCERLPGVRCARPAGQRRPVRHCHLGHRGSILSRWGRRHREPGLTAARLLRELSARGPRSRRMSRERAVVPGSRRNGGRRPAGTARRRRRPRGPPPREGDRSEAPVPRPGGSCGAIRRSPGRPPEPGPNGRSGASVRASRNRPSRTSPVGFHIMPTCGSSLSRSSSLTGSCVTWLPSSSKTLIPSTRKSASRVPSLSEAARSGTSHKRVVVGSDLVSGAAYTTMFVLAAVGLLGPPELLGLSLVAGVATAAFVPNVSALVPMIAPGSNLDEANAARMVTAQVAGIIGLRWPARRSPSEACRSSCWRPASASFSRR